MTNAISTALHQSGHCCIPFHFTALMPPKKMTDCVALSWCCPVCSLLLLQQVGSIFYSTKTKQVWCQTMQGSRWKRCFVTEAVQILESSAGSAPAAGRIWEMSHHILGEHGHGPCSHLLLPHPSSGCTSELPHFIPVCEGSRIT